jgi:hypothetical protein
VTAAARAALLLGLLGLLAPAAAGAQQLTVSRGDVSATLSYSRDAADFGYTTEKLTIVRGGQMLYDAIPHPAGCQDFACGPTVGFGFGQPPLIVRDLNADGEPEVIYTAYTGGAHCCILAQVFELAPGGAAYTAADRFFGDPGFGLGDLDSDGRLEIVTADDAFAYRFTSYAFSGLPLQVLRYDHGRFADVTNAFPGALRREAGVFWHAYKRLRKNRDDTPRGLIAAWAADQYRLGKRRYALEILHREARRGYLSHPDASGKFIRALDRFLRRGGYA